MRFLPTVKRLHGNIPGLLDACDAVEQTHRVLWANAPGSCPGHPTCFRLTLIVVRRRSRHSMTPGHTTA